MDANNKIQLLADKQIHTTWDEVEQEWYFSIVDVVLILTDQSMPWRNNARDIIELIFFNS